MPKSNNKQGAGSGDNNNAQFGQLLAGLTGALRPIDTWSEAELLKAIEDGNQKKEALRVLRQKHGEGYRIVVDDSTSSPKVIADETIEMNEWVLDNQAEAQFQWAGHSVMTIADFTGAVVSINPITDQPMPPGSPWEKVPEDLQVLIVLARKFRNQFTGIVGADEFTLLAELTAPKVSINSLKTHPRWGNVARYAALKTNKDEVQAAKATLTRKRGGAAPSGGFFREDNGPRRIF